MARLQGALLLVLAAVFVQEASARRFSNLPWSIMKGKGAAAGAGSTDPKPNFDANVSNKSLAEEAVLLWPLPQSFTRGSAHVQLRRPLHFQAVGPAADSPLLLAAFERTNSLIFTHPAHHVFAQEVGSDKVVELSEVIVSVASADETLQLETDESYYLEVPSNGSAAIVEAATVYGVLQALQTLSQLTHYDWHARVVQIQQAPWSITDAPRFRHRGLLVDTSRHYEPMKFLRLVVDSMAYAKLNVLHWHIVDDQSFPLEIPSFPKLWQGSYSEEERFSLDDASELVEYARLRGVKVMAELDVPGHTKCWGIGYPELWPSLSCRSLLDISKPFTFELIDGILSDFAKVFPYRLLHLGGDEVDTTCWTQTPRVKEWLVARNLSAHDAYAEFVLRAQRLALARGWEPVNWEEPFDEFGERLHPNSIVHNWIQPGIAPKVVAAGHRCIVSNQDVWYLDHLDVPWEQFYNNEPHAGINDLEEQKLVLGGEVCMWGETADPSDVLQTIWPRAAAAAERLWSPRKAVEEGSRGEVLERLEWFRCLLTKRGIPAAPVRNFFARESPPYPGSCYQQ